MPGSCRRAHAERKGEPRQDGNLPRVDRAESPVRADGNVGVEPIVGRTFLPEDGRNLNVILSYDFWRRRCGADESVLGQPLPGSSAVIVGIMPPDLSPGGTRRRSRPMACSPVGSRTSDPYANRLPPNTRIHCICFRAPSVSFCSSPAATWPTCSWLAARHGKRLCADGAVR